MNKVGRTQLKRLMMLAMAILMCVGTAIPALAINGGAIPAADEDHPAVVDITKVFKMPEGTEVPVGATFPFEFTKVSYNADTSAGAQAVMPMPAAGSIAVALTNSETIVPASGIDTITKQFADFGAEFAFTQPGIYVYTVKEGALTGYTPGTDETFTNSPAEYTLTFWVNPHSSSGVYIDAIAVNVITKDDGSAGGDAKVDLDTDASAFAFTNKYYKDTGDTNPAGAVALGVSKKVDTSGTFIGDVNKYFAFEVVATRPSTLPATDYTTYTLGIRNATSKTVVPPVAAHAITGATVAGNVITYTPGATLAISLKHDEELVFTKMPIGAKYIATELGAVGYTATVNGVENGTAFTKSGTLGTACNTDQVTPTARQRIIGKNTNSAEFLNQGSNSPVTGIIMNNLPYIAILLLAVGAFAAFIVVKSRKREGQEN